jgi:Putative beta-barrel porin 2
MTFVIRARRLAGPTCGAALLMLSSARPTSAQSSLILPETHVFRAGPLSVYPTIAVRDVGADSNVYNDSTGPKGDFTYTVAPRMYLVVPVANSRFVGTGFGNLVYFQTYKDQQSIGGLFQARYEVMSPGFRPFATAGFADRRERRGLEIDTRARQRQTTVTLGAEMDITTRTALTGWVGRVGTAWDHNAEYLGVSLSEQLDYRSDLVAAGARFRATPLTTIGMTAEMRRDRFDRSPVRDADRLFVGPTIDFDAGATVVGHARVGYQRFDALDAMVADYRGVAATTELRYMFRDFTEVKLEAQHDVDYSYDPLEPYYMEASGALTVSQRVVGPLRMIGIGERHSLRHQRLAGTSFDGREEITQIAGGGVAVQIRKQFRFEVIYQRTERTSSVPGWREYQRRRLVASFFYGQ